MKKFFIIFSSSVFLFSATNAQTIHAKKLDSLFNTLQNHGLANGSIAISINGKVAYQKTIGFAVINQNKKIAANINTKYRVGSVTKMFTAVMIFQLIEERKLSLTQKLAVYFPQLPNADRITIEDMLYHRSGLHNYTVDTNFPDWMDKPKSQDELLKIVVEKGTDFEPGTKADYCNTNYLLLSYIIEKLCKMPYAKAVEKRIISKIGLVNTYYGKPIDINRNESASYKYADSVWRKEKEANVDIHSGAGAIVSTPTDLIKFIQKLFEGKLISESSLNKMKTMIDGYGMGMFPYDFNKTKGYGHNGRIEEFYSAVRYYPEKKLAISYITNGILYPRVDIMDGILKICFNDFYTIPCSKPVALQGSDLDKYLGEYSGKSLPFKVVCRKNQNKLILEVAGSSMAAELINNNYFMNAKTGAFFEFNPEKDELQIKETDNIYYLKRQR